MEKIQTKTAATSIISMKLQCYIVHIFFFPPLFGNWKELGVVRRECGEAAQFTVQVAAKAGFVSEKPTRIFSDCCWISWWFPRFISTSFSIPSSELCPALEEYKHKHEAWFAGRFLNSDWKNSHPRCCKTLGTQEMWGFAIPLENHKLWLTLCLWGCNWIRKKSLIDSEELIRLTTSWRCACGASLWKILTFRVWHPIPSQNIPSWGEELPGSCHRDQRG